MPVSTYHNGRVAEIRFNFGFESENLEKRPIISQNIGSYDCSPIYIRLSKLKSEVPGSSPSLGISLSTVLFHAWLTPAEGEVSREAK